MLFDLKTLNSVLHQIEEEKRIPKKKIISAIEDSLAAAYKKEYGQKGQVIKSNFNIETGDLDFFQIKKVVDENITTTNLDGIEEGSELELFNEDQHILLENARLMRGEVSVGDEIIFPLENPIQEKDSGFGRIASQVAKQVVMQKIRAAERESIIEEYSDMDGEILSGFVKRVEKGNVFIDFERATGVMTRDEQISGEFWKNGDRIRVYLYGVGDDTSEKPFQLQLSRSHKDFVPALFAIESPEIDSGAVEIKSVAREAGSRTKIAVLSHDENIDAIGACVGARGVRINTVMRELNNEKIDIIQWSENEKDFIENALAPAKILSISLNDDEKIADISVSQDQLSLAIGRGGQNVRLAAKLTGWNININGSDDFNLRVEEVDNKIE